MRAADVPAGTLVFLPCGCGGFKGLVAQGGPVPVVIQRPCPAHENRPTPWLELIGPDDEISPFTPDTP
jgi:hypothetical protein